MSFKFSKVIFALLLIILFLLSGCACDPSTSSGQANPGQADDDDDSDDDDDDSISFDDGEDDGTSWTMVIYMAADNDLESFAREDLKEMVGVGSVDRVNIVVIFDGAINGDSAYWHVQKDALVIEQSPGELNMGDPETLITSVTWAFENFPADKYALVLWDHGSGWHKGGDAPRDKSICQDSGSGDDWLENEEIDYALLGIRDQSGISKLDILAFDACLMQMIEMAYFVRDDAGILVGSQEVVNITGFDYNEIFLRMVNNPGITPRLLSTRIVESFIDTPDATLSAINLNRVDEVAEAVDELAALLIDVGGLGNSQVESALFETLYFDDYDYIDLYHFALNIAAKEISLDINNRCDDIIMAMDDAVIANEYGFSDYQNAGGLSIYFPDPEYSYFDDAYFDLDFAADTRWDELIEF